MLNLVVLGLLIYEYWKQTKKYSYAVILNKNGEAISSIRINPSYNEFEHKYEDKKYSYILPESTSFIKFKNFKIYLYEFEKPEPLNPIKDVDPKMTANVFNELLQMRKIKALNEAKNSIFDGINKKYLFAGVVVVILIIVLLNGGI